MEKERLLAFTDGVVAIIVTIMVLELHTPHGATLQDLLRVAPTFAGYVLSFVYVAIYWNNHHHLFHLVRQVNGAVLWANLNLLFWLSLLPFATEWAGEHHADAVPVALYGVALLLPAIAWRILQATIVRAGNTAIRRTLGWDWKSALSPLLYALGIGMSFWDTRVAIALYALVALIWLVPDRRIERAAKRA